MGKLSVGPVVLLAVTLALPACGGTGSDRDSDAGATSSTASAESSSTESTSSASTSTKSTSSGTETSSSTSKPPKGIRSVDFADLDWADPAKPGQTLTVLESADGFAGVVQGEPQYMDIDGDGHDDAIVRVRQGEGNGFLDSRSVWLWDPDAEEAKQVLPALTIEARCDNVTTDIQAVDAGKLVVTRKMREGEACAVTPEKTVKFTMEVEDGFVWQTAPFVSALHCPASPPRDLVFRGDDLGDYGLKPWPEEGAPDMVTGEDVAAFDTNDDAQGLPAGWTQQEFISKSNSADGEPQCGYLG